MSKRYELHGERIAVRPDRPDEKAAPDSVIVKPQRSIESKQFGSCVSVSEELKHTYREKGIEFVLPEPGDRIIWGDMMGIDLSKISDDDVVILRYPAEVIATVRYDESAGEPVAEVNTDLKALVAKYGEQNAGGER